MFNTTMTIVDGPSMWGMILAIFEGKAVRFHFAEDEVAYANDFDFEIRGGHFYDRGRNIFHFSTMFPWPNDKGSIGVEGEIDFRTRKGMIDVTSLVERGAF